MAKAISDPIINRLMLGGAAFSLLFALLGWWAAERLADPLRALARAAGDVSNAPADARLPKPRGYLEISELTGALTGLLVRLSERDRALEQANADLEGVSRPGRWNWPRPATGPRRPSPAPKPASGPRATSWRR
ncbi:hypothetical protein ACFQFG_05980 [Methylobacterium persicinum]